MTLILRIALALAVLQTEGFAVRDRIDNAQSNRPRNEQLFPPDEPVPVVLDRVTKDGFVTGLLIPVTTADIQFSLLLDTGSSQTWVISTQMKGVDFAQKQKYPLPDSESCPETFKYADGTIVSGFWKTNDVTVSGWTRKDYSIVAAVNIEDDREDFFTSSKAQGVFGASAKPLTKGSPDPWLTNTRFNIDVNPQGENSMLTYGIAKSSSGNSIDIPMHVGGQWIIQSTDLGWVHLDTGANNLWLPSDFLTLYFAGTKSWPPKSKDNDSDEWLVDCEQALPDMEIDLGDDDVSVTVRGIYLKLPYSSANPEGRCDVRIVEETDENELMVLGMPFFESNIVTFDATEPQRRISISSR